MELDIERIGLDFEVTFRVRGCLSLIKDFYEKCANNEALLDEYLEEYALDNWERLDVDCEVEII